MVGLDGYLTNSMWIYTSEQHLVSLCASLSIWCMGRGSTRGTRLLALPFALACNYNTGSKEDLVRLNVWLSISNPRILLSRKTH